LAGHCEPTVAAAPQSTFLAAGCTVLREAKNLTVVRKLVQGRSRAGNIMARGVRSRLRYASTSVGSQGTRRMIAARRLNPLRIRRS
jgi:hypothetical protein